jgi:tetratricopeptide (TPR) repeat protein
MSHKFRIAIGLVLFSGSMTPVLACLWDSDTLEQERSRFPTVLELVTGKFPRHSREFYKWRVRDRSERLKQHPDDPALYDDLAVAHEKLGDHQRAIELMLEKDEKFPGKYETYANLGTFYIHDGQFELGLEQIERAIAINPDAHFGREVYQQRLVEYVRYVRSRQSERKMPLPLVTAEQRNSGSSRDFDNFALKAVFRPSEKERDEELNKAVQGILGMMRFGNHDSPILLEALGDLLSSHEDIRDSKHLAARAYLKASYEVDDAESRDGYRKLAEEALMMQLSEHGVAQELTLAALEKTFQQELAEADAWYAQLVAGEQIWIAAGKNPELEFQRKYREEPRQSRRGGLLRDEEMIVLLGISLVGLLLVAALFLTLWLARRRFLAAGKTPKATGKPLVDVREMPT